MYIRRDVKTTDGMPGEARRKPELLAPAGDAESLRAAVAGGADAVYVGFSRFNARRRARNIEASEFGELTAFAHGHGVKVYVTFNILIPEEELSDLMKAASEAVRCGADGFIVQDYGAARLFAERFPDVCLHASTQMTTCTEEQLRFLAGFGFRRVNLARELSIGEIRTLTSAAHALGMETEVFVHGAYCVSYSGQCLFSSWLGGQSGNRGLCFQPCRRRWKDADVPGPGGFPFSLKDNGAMTHVREIIMSGADSLKIEGRMKGPFYVQTATERWRAFLDGDANAGSGRAEPLSTIFNRGYHDGYLTGKVGTDMFVETPLDRSRIVAGRIERFGRSGTVRDGEDLALLAINVSIEPGATANGGETRITPGTALSISTSENRLIARGTVETSAGDGTLLFRIRERFGGIRAGQLLLHDGTGPEERRAEKAREDLWLEWKRRCGQSVANGTNGIVQCPGESVRTDSARDVAHRSRSLPEGGRFKGFAVLIDDTDEIDAISRRLTSDDLLLFEATDPSEFPRERQLAPWFPSVMLEDHIRLWNERLTVAKPPLILSNSSAFAGTAVRAGVPWIAGPGLNAANSAAVLALATTGGAAGVLLSEELSVSQARAVTATVETEIWVKLYGPVLLMTVRSCPLAGLIRCGKAFSDEECGDRCSRSVTLANDAHERVRLVKRRGRPAELWSEEPAVVMDLTDGPGKRADRYFLDFRNPGPASGTESASLVSRLDMLAHARERAARDGSPAERTEPHDGPRSSFPYGLA